VFTEHYIQVSFAEFQKDSQHILHLIVGITPDILVYLRNTVV